VSFLVHFGFVVYLRAMQRPKEPDLLEIPDSFVRMMVTKKIEPPKPPPVQKTEAQQKTAETKKDDEAKKPDAAKPKDKPKAEDPAAAAKAEAERLARVEKQVEAQGVLKMLLAKGPGGVLTDMLKDGSGDSDPDKVFSQVGGVGPATGKGGLGDTRGSGGAGTSKTIGGLIASGPSENVGTGQKSEKQVKAVVTETGPQELDPVDLDPAAVAAKIRQYRGALVACYETALKKNPNLSGKITLRFTIGRVGKVTKVEIEVDTMHDEEVNQCIVDRASNWRFPAPQSGTDGVQFAYPFIFQSAK
jgi:TonB family protein